MFYTLLRIRIRTNGDYIANAVKYDNRDTATRQFFSLIATDMGDADLQYHSCCVIDETNTMVEGRTFDRRTQEE